MQTIRKRQQEFGNRFKAFSGGSAARHCFASAGPSRAEARPAAFKFSAALRTPFCVTFGHFSSLF